MKLTNEYLQSLKLARRLFKNLAIACFLIQILLNFSYENVICNLLTVGIFILVTELVFEKKNKNIADALIATVIFLTVASNSIVPTLGTLLDGHTLVYSLNRPVETYFHRFIYGLLISFAFFVYRNRTKNSIKEIFSRISDRHKLNILLPKNLVWGLGLISLFLFFFKGILPLPLELYKFLDGFGILLYSPFILILPIYKTDNRKLRNRTLLIYFAVMVILSFLTNSRQAIVNPVASVAAGWLILLITGDVILNSRLIQRGLIGGVVGLFLIGSFSDLSTAILIQRANRDNNTVEEKITATFNTFLDKKAIDEYLKEQSVSTSLVVNTNEWQENYMRNPFLIRFVQIKFDDNLFMRLGGYDDLAKNKLRQATYDKILATFPTPVLKLFGSTIDKDYVNSFSIADLMTVLSGDGFLGGFLTGSITAASYAIFGWNYVFVLFFIYLLLFYIYGGFASHSLGYNNKEERISTLALVFCFSLFSNFSLDGITNLIPVILRGVWQSMLIYYLAIRLIIKLNIS
ncbi:hypothetical protein ACFOW1_14865 [Parasediminibacterium paludis]|uniref:O-antigen polysaccharide polymerase Wzy-like protein n=1 Tax=Parasediminibacterium paludis TaxID=908966 RepID=A0ABV8Q131_9BACT